MKTKRYRCDHCGDWTNKSYSDDSGNLCEACWLDLTADFSGDNSVETETKEVTME